MKKLHRLPTNALVLVCDAKKALFLRNVGTEIHPKLEVIETRMPEPPEAETDLKGNPPGRRPDARPADGSHGPRSAMEEPDFERLKEEKFTASVIARIPGIGSRIGMKALVVAAPARMLGSFRKQLPKDLEDAILAEIPKRLTHVPMNELTEHLVADW